MKIQIEIETGNAAFDDRPMDEVARILHVLARRLEHDGVLTDEKKLHDVNGNRVGYARVVKADEIAVICEALQDRRQAIIRAAPLWNMSDEGRGLCEFIETIIKRLEG